MRKLKLEELNRISVEDFREAEKPDLVVLLDNVRSKNNVGAVFRNSDAFRVRKLYLCGYTPCPPDRDITKTAIGAETSVDWAKSDDIVATVTQLKAEGYRVMAVEQTDNSTLLNEFKPEPGGKYALVMGNEVEGVSDAVISLCDIALEIPQFGTKHSLNISVASGIVLYAIAIKLLQE